VRLRGSVSYRPRSFRPLVPDRKPAATETERAAISRGKKGRGGGIRKPVQSALICTIPQELAHFVSAGEQTETKKDRTNANVAEKVAESPPGLKLVILEAARAGQWGVVAILAKELEAERLANSNVVRLADVKRGGK
jgi:hypothetical protein